MVWVGMCSEILVGVTPGSGFLFPPVSGAAVSSHYQSLKPNKQVSLLPFNAQPQYTLQFLLQEQTKIYDKVGIMKHVA